jgi:hypothetical protein
MTDFTTFSAGCKMRHDYDDMIQVRYHHSNGEDYDTWVSGDEVLSRLHSEMAEEKLRGLRDLDWKKILATREEWPEEAKDRAEESVLDILADNIQENIGGNIIGDSLSDAVRGRPSDPDSPDSTKARWLIFLQDEIFRAKVLKLAWIQLEGSFPDEQTAEEPDDWV